VGLKFNPPPGWPLLWDFEPPPGWAPDPDWPEPPPGWPLWIGADAPRVLYQVPADERYVPGYVRAALASAPQGPARRSSKRRKRASSPPPAPRSPAGNRAKRSRGGARGGHRRRRKGPSVGGQVALAVVGLAAVGFIVLELLGPGIGDPSGATTARGGPGIPVSLLSLRTGACFRAARSVGRDASDVTPVPCTLAHNAQVYARFSARGGSVYPGRGVLIRQGRSDCRSALAGALDTAKLTSRISLINIVPSQRGWAAGQRMISCVAVDSAGPLTTSLLKNRPQGKASRSRRALGPGQRRGSAHVGAKHPRKVR
jgi:hypothetical protein